MLEGFEPMTYCSADRGLNPNLSQPGGSLQLEFKNLSIIRKEKTKEIYVIMSVFISNKDTAKLYVQFFRPK